MMASCTLSACGWYPMANTWRHRAVRSRRGPPSPSSSAGPGGDRNDVAHQLTFAAAVTFSATHLYGDHRGESARWRWFVLWTSCLLALWMAVWIVHEAVFVPRGWCLASWSAGVYWTVAKLAVWICPTIWLLRRSHETLGAATGLG